MVFGEAFLTLPELFPARQAGEPWGEDRVALELAGSHYSISGLDPSQARVLRRRFEGWLGYGEARAPISIRVFRAPAEEFREPDTSEFQEYRLDLGHEPDRVRLAGFHVMAVLDLAPEISGSLWTSKSGPAFLGACENFLRLAAAYRILASGGVLLHSAALVRGGEAVVFPGRSGAGKSTLSRIGAASGWQVLSDELNVVRNRAPELTVEQVPFTGDLDPDSTLRAPGRSFRQAGLCRLEKAERDDLSPLPAGRMLGALLATAPYVNRDSYRGEELSAVLERAAVETPAFTFAFHRASRLEPLDSLFATADAA